MKVAVVGGGLAGIAAALECADAGADVTLLDYPDRYVDRAEPHHAIAAIAGHIRRIRPDVVITFGPDGAYGHPDHIAISQFASAAIAIRTSSSATPTLPSS